MRRIRLFKREMARVSSEFALNAGTLSGSGGRCCFRYLQHQLPNPPLSDPAVSTVKMRRMGNDAVLDTCSFSYEYLGAKMSR